MSCQHDPQSCAARLFDFDGRLALVLNSGDSMGEWTMGETLVTSIKRRWLKFARVIVVL